MKVIYLNRKIIALAEELYRWAFPGMELSWCGFRSGIRKAYYLAREGKPESIEPSDDDIVMEWLAGFDSFRYLDFDIDRERRVEFR